PENSVQILELTVRPFESGQGIDAEAGLQNRARRGLATGRQHVIGQRRYATERGPRCVQSCDTVGETGARVTELGHKRAVFSLEIKRHEQELRVLVDRETNRAAELL